MKKLIKALTLSTTSILALNFVGCTTTPKGSSAYGVNNSNAVVVSEVISNYVQLKAPAANTNLLIVPDRKKSVIYSNVQTILQNKGYAIVEAPLPENTLVTVLKYRVSPVANNAVSIVINLAGNEAVGMAFKVNNQWKPFTSYTVKEN